MTYEFTAIDCEAQMPQAFVGFANDDHYVWIQPDEDVALSASGDHIWLEIIDQQFGGPGGIEKVHLSRHGFLVSLTPIRATRTGGYDTVSVHFAISDDQYERIRSVLLKAMRGCEQLVEIEG